MKIKYKIALLVGLLVIVIFGLYLSLTYTPKPLPAASQPIPSAKTPDDMTNCINDKGEFLPPNQCKG